MPGSGHVSSINTREANNLGCHLHNIFVPQAELVALSQGERIDDALEAAVHGLPSMVNRRKERGLLPANKADRA